MFDDLYDVVSRLWSWHWPIAQGEVTAVGFQQIPRIDTADEVSLTVTYRFSVNDDGPFTGIRTWTSTHYRISDLLVARDQFHEGDAVKVRYRTDDPSEQVTARFAALVVMRACE
jgi:hypothetical protein